MKQVGVHLFRLCIFCLVVASIIRVVFFKELIGTGWTTARLWIVIPIWTIGIVGVALILVGWIRDKPKAIMIEIQFPDRKTEIKDVPV